MSALIRTSLMFFCLFFLSHCLLIQRGSQQWQTLVWAIAGILFLLLGLRFLMWHMMGDPNKTAIVRFLIGLVAGIVIFIG